MLKRVVKSLDDVDEKYRDLYEKSGSEYHLKTDDDGRLKEFRENNIELRKKNEELDARLKAMEEKYGGIDPEEVKKGQELLKQMKDEEEKTLIKAGKIDEVVQRRVAVAISERENQIKEMQTTLGKKDSEIQSLRNGLSVLTIDHQVQAAVEAAGVKPRTGAIHDILARARTSWRLGEDGKPYAVDEEGKKRYGGDGNPLTMPEFVKKDLVEKAGHLFESAGGGGASGGKGSGGPAGGVRRIDPSDVAEFGRNIEKIAKGEVEVGAAD